MTPSMGLGVTPLGMEGVATPSPSAIPKVPITPEQYQVGGSRMEELHGTLLEVSLAAEEHALSFWGCVAVQASVFCYSNAASTCCSS